MNRPEVHKTLASALAGTPAASRFWRLALALLLGVVTYLALASPSQPQVDLGWDKLNHLVAFVTLAVIGSLGFARTRGRVALSLLAFGALIEVLQSFTTDRSAAWDDLLVDALGIAIGLLLAYGLAQATSRYTRSAP